MGLFDFGAKKRAESEEKARKVIQDFIELTVNDWGSGVAYFTGYRLDWQGDVLVVTIKGKVIAMKQSREFMLQGFEKTALGKKCAASQAALKNFKDKDVIEYLKNHPSFKVEVRSDCR